MADYFEVTSTVRLEVQDARALVAAARGHVPDAALNDEHLGLVVALQALVKPSNVDQVPGVAVWRGLGWSAQVGAKRVEL